MATDKAGKVSGSKVMKSHVKYGPSYLVQGWHED